MTAKRSKPKAKTAAAKPKAPRRSAGRAGASPGASQGALRQMIELVAYYRAERRGFALGGELNDWLEAEAEVLASLPAQGATGRTKGGGGHAG